MRYWLRLNHYGRYAAVGVLLTLLVVTTWAAGARRFELETGSAEAVLNEFAVQTGLQVLFPTELAAGIETNTVRGHYTVKEALDRMLSDTGLTAKYNERTGVIEISRTRPNGEEIVRLPPYTVEGETKVWRYAQMGNIEVISTCMDDVTRRVIEQLFRLQEALEQIVPPDLMFNSSAPVVYVLHSDSDKAAVPQEMANRLKQEHDRTISGDRLAWNISLMSSYAFWDMDGRAVYFILNEGMFLAGRLSIRGDYLRALLEGRAPAMPEWFVEGLLELYRTISLEPYGAADMPMQAKEQPKIPGGVAKVGAFMWISPEETLRVRKQRPELLPLAKFFEGPPSHDAIAYQRWKAQAALFVRWALDDAKNGRQALWKMVRLADSKNLTEADFQTCFGLDYADAQEDIRRYLPKALRWDFEIKPWRFAEMPEINLRLATQLDVSIVKGDLDRLKIDYVRRFAPSLTKWYSAQARTTLFRAQNMGDSNARLAGLIGLYESNAGDDLAARAWLEQAVASGDARPRVYYELARIRFNAARAAHVGKLLPDDELAGLISLVDEAVRRAPPLLAAYELLAEILNAGRPTPEQIRVLSAGLAYFPREIGLVKAVALLWQKQGREDEARVTIEHGLSMISALADRNDLIKFSEDLSFARVVPYEKRS